MDTDAVPLLPADRAILDIECETIAGHTCKVIRLAPGAPGLDAVRARIAERITAVPELTRRLGTEGGRPAWVPAGSFDLDRRVVALAGTPLPPEQVPIAVAELFAQRLDRDHPLWQLHVGTLRGGGGVLIWRIHHALADGTAAMRFARGLLWDEVQRGGAGQVAGTAAAASSGSSPHPDEARRHRHLLAVIEREFAESIDRSPFDGEVGALRQIAFASVDLAPLRDAARSLAGATVNDAVLTVVAGSLRRWLEQHHGSLRGVRVRVPVSLHAEGDAAANLDSFFSLHLPLGAADPAERLRAVRAATSRRKEAHDAEELRSLLDELGAVSARMRALCDRIEASPRSFALSVSNVPGPRYPVTLLRAPVEAIHSIAEIGERHALRIAVVSLAGRLHFGFCADPSIVGDLDAMAGGVEPEAAALVEAAGL